MAVIQYINTDSHRCDDYEVHSKTTPIEVVIKRCRELGCYGFTRGSNHEGRGKYYIRSPKHTADNLKAHMKPYKNVSLFVLKELRDKRP